MSNERLAKWILSCTVDPDGRDAVLGDLVEEYAIRGDTTPRFAAWCWYWMQVVRTIPWLLFLPVRRGGCWTTFAVAFAACAVQATIELGTATVLPAVEGASPPALSSLAIVVASLVLVSCLASRLRPGAGTLLTLLTSVAVITRTVASGIDAVSVSRVIEAMCAPLAAFTGAALATASSSPQKHR